jgi:hypothetical protein
MLNEAPGLVRGGMSPGIRPLFHSRREIALIKDKSANSGFGVLKAGRVLATTTVDGQVVPVPVDDGSVDTIDIARPRLAVNYVSGESTFSLSEADAAKFRVGDAVDFNNETPVYADMGSITAIGAPIAGVVIVTVDGSAVSTVMTTALSAAVSHKTAAATPFYAASCLLDKDIDTGVSAETNAVPCSVVFKNAMVYTVYLTGMSDKSITDLGAIQDGVHTII